jgi:hypothetical protein
MSLCRHAHNSLPNLAIYEEIYKEQIFAAYSSTKQVSVLLSVWNFIWKSSALNFGRITDCYE